MRTVDERASEIGGRRRLSAAGWAVLCLAALALAGAGCAHSRARREAKQRAEALIPPPIPPFLSGPAALLLTNTGGFSCHLVMETGPASAAGKPLVGEFFGRGSKLFFSPDPSSFDHRTGGFGFLWDVAEGRGFLLCDAMQGYAPISSRFHATSLVARPTSQGSRKIAGRECEPKDVSVSATDAPTEVLHVWEAASLKNFPVRLSGVEGRPFDVTLSKVRLSAPAADMFQPPEGFARFESAEGMLAEMVMRQEKLKRKPTEELSTPDTKPQPGIR
jgi:hypothetical protein